MTIDQLFAEHVADIDSEPFAHEDFWADAEDLRREMWREMERGS